MYSPGSVTGGLFLQMVLQRRNQHVSAKRMPEDDHAMRRVGGRSSIGVDLQRIFDAAKRRQRGRRDGLADRFAIEQCQHGGRGAERIAEP